MVVATLIGLITQGYRPKKVCYIAHLRIMCIEECEFFMDTQEDKEA